MDLINESKIRLHNAYNNNKESKYSWYYFIIININTKEFIIVKSINNNIEDIYKIFNYLYKNNFFHIISSNMQEINEILNNSIKNSNNSWMILNTNSNISFIKKNYLDLINNTTKIYIKILRSI
jgi:hypothetical protein